MNLVALALYCLLATSPKTTTVPDAGLDGGLALTPMDQSNDEADVKLTQAIRQALMDDSRLSFTSKNVKIITRSSEVTLRGEVPNKSERAAVVAIATRVAGVRRVTDLLELPLARPANRN